MSAIDSIASDSVRSDRPGRLFRPRSTRDEDVEIAPLVIVAPRHGSEYGQTTHAETNAQFSNCGLQAIKDNLATHRQRPSAEKAGSVGPESPLIDLDPEPRTRTICPVLQRWSIRSYCGPSPLGAPESRARLARGPGRLLVFQPNTQDSWYQAQRRRQVSMGTSVHQFSVPVARFALANGNRDD